MLLCSMGVLRVPFDGLCLMDSVCWAFFAGFYLIRFVKLLGQYTGMLQVLWCCADASLTGFLEVSDGCLGLIER